MNPEWDLRGHKGRIDLLDSGIARIIVADLTDPLSDVHTFSYTVHADTELIHEEKFSTNGRTMLAHPERVKSHDRAAMERCRAAIDAWEAQG